MIHVAIPGQPPSLNKLYEIGQRYDRNGILYRGRRKSDAAHEYQAIVERAVAKAKPKGWDPGPWDPKSGEGMIVIRYWWYLKAMVDCDNAKKTLNDGIALGLGTKIARGRSGIPRVVPIFDDSRFLGQDMWRQTGCAEPFVSIQILSPGEW